MTSETRGSRAHAPDLDWTQVRETVLMIELAAGQIEGALTDSNSSVETLTGSFTAMAGHMQAIADALAGLPDDPACAPVKARLQGVTDEVAGMVHRAIIAFQFYDKLVQRLSHVNLSLDGLSQLVGDSSRLYNPNEWRVLQDGIRAKYSMREEQQMFEAVMQGMPVKDAVQQFMNEMKDRSDDIELF